MHAYVYVHVSIWDLSLSQKDNIYSKRNKKNNVLHYCFFFAVQKEIVERCVVHQCVHPTIWSSLHPTLPLSSNPNTVLQEGWQIVQSNTLHVGENLKISTGHYFFSHSLSLSLSLHRKRWKLWQIALTFWCVTTHLAFSSPLPSLLPQEAN